MAWTYWISDGCNIRNGPGTSYDIVGRTVRYSGVSVYGFSKDDKWGQLNESGTRWCSKNYLSSVPVKNDNPAIESCEVTIIDKTTAYINVSYRDYNKDVVTLSISIDGGGYSQLTSGAYDGSYSGSIGTFSRGSYHSYTVKANDDYGGVSYYNGNFSLPGNNSPSITITDYDINPSSRTVKVYFSASDSDGDSLSFTPDSYFNSGSGYCYFYNCNYGNNRLRVYVNDGYESSSDYIDVNVVKPNTAPSISGFYCDYKDRTGTATFRWNYSDAEGDSVSWGMYVDGSYTSINVFPDSYYDCQCGLSRLSPGKHEIKLRAYDGREYAYSTITIDMPKNIKPTLSIPYVHDVTRNGDYTVDWFSSDQDSDDLSFSLKIDNSSYVKISPTVNEDPNNKYMYKGTGLSTGSHTAVIRVTDGIDVVDSQSFNIVIPANQAPVILNVSVDKLISNGTADISFSCLDYEQDTITYYYKMDTEDFVSFTPTGEDSKFKYTFTGLSIGTHECVLKASDGRDVFISDVIQIVIPENNLPIVENIEVSELLYDENKAIVTATCLDPDKWDTLTFYIKVDDKPYTLTTPTLLEDNVYKFEFTDLSAERHWGFIKASDGYDEVVTSSFMLDMIDNAKPIITDIVPMTKTTGLYALKFRAIDVEDDPITFYLKIDDGDYVQLDVTRDGTTYTTPYYSYPFGRYTCVIKADDGFHESFSDEFILPLAPVNPPVISDTLIYNTHYKGDYTFGFSCEYDGDEEDLTFYVKVNDGDFEEIIVQKTEEKLEYSYTGKDMPVGTNTCYIKAFDKYNEVMSESFLVEVDENTAPEIKNIEISNITLLGSFTMTIEVEDVDRDPLFFELNYGRGYQKIAPSMLDGYGNKYSYKGNYLKPGLNYIYLKVNDGNLETISSPIEIRVPYGGDILVEAYTKFNIAYTELRNYIPEVMEDKIYSEEEKVKLNELFTKYKESYANYKQKVSQVIDYLNKAELNARILDVNDKITALEQSIPVRYNEETDSLDFVFDL